MPDTVNTRIKLKRDTTANWNAARGFIPMDGEVIIYTDYKTVTYTEGGVTKTRNIPGIKVGTGNAYVQDLGFIDDELRDRLMEHIANMELHISPAQRRIWNNKLNYDDTLEIDDELVNETLVLTRN